MWAAILHSTLQKTFKLSANEASFYCLRRSGYWMWFESGIGFWTIRYINLKSIQFIQGNRISRFNWYNWYGANVWKTIYPRNIHLDTMYWPLFLSGCCLSLFRLAREMRPLFKRLKQVYSVLNDFLLEQGWTVRVKLWPVP